jgi:hypothetical protein
VIHQDDPDNYHLVENVPTPEKARNMGLDPSNHRVYIVSAQFAPAAGAEKRPPVQPGTFKLMVIERSFVAR